MVITNLKSNRTPNHARDCVKTQIWSFCKTKKWFKSPSLQIKMRHNENVNVAFSSGRVVGEFSHSLALQRTAASRGLSSLRDPMRGPGR